MMDESIRSAMTLTALVIFSLKREIEKHVIAVVLMMELQKQKHQIFPCFCEKKVEQKVKSSLCSF